MNWDEFCVYDKSHSSHIGFKYGLSEEVGFRRELHGECITVAKLLVFKHFAEIQERVIQPKSKKAKRSHIYEPVGDVFKNQSTRAVRVIGSNWFTRLVFTEGSMVSGHFRSQPYGEGKLQRKLIYIQPKIVTGKPI